MQFAVNDRPAGARRQAGDRAAHLDRLVKEIRTNVALRISQTDLPNIFNVSGRR